MFLQVALAAMTAVSATLTPPRNFLCPVSAQIFSETNSTSKHPT
jgi:hypothetical protein